MGETLEELRAQNEQLRKEIEAIELAKAKREQNELKAKIEKQKEIDLQRHDEELLARHGINKGSKIASGTTSQAMNLAKDNEHIEFGQAFVDRMRKRGLPVGDKPLSYTELMDKIVYKEYRDAHHKGA